MAKKQNTFEKRRREMDSARKQPRNDRAVALARMHLRSSRFHPSPQLHLRIENSSGLRRSSVRRSNGDGLPPQNPHPRTHPDAARIV